MEKIKYKLVILLCLIAGIGGFFTAYFPLKSEQAWVGMLFNFMLFLPIWFALTNLIGWRKAIFTFIGLSLLAIIIENIAIISCMPYGCFNYYDNIGPRFVLPTINLGGYNFNSILLFSHNL